MDWGTIIVAIISSSALSGLVIYLFERRARKRQAEAAADKVQAEARSINADADNKTLEGAFRLIGVLEKQMGCYEEEQSMLKRRVGRLEELLKAAYQRIEDLMLGIRKLVQQIRNKGDEPCWEPDEWDPETS